MICNYFLVAPIVESIRYVHVYTKISYKQLHMHNVMYTCIMRHSSSYIYLTHSMPCMPQILIVKHMHNTV